MPEDHASLRTASGGGTTRRASAADGTGDVDLLLAWSTANPAHISRLLNAVGFGPEAAGSGETLAVPGLRLAVTRASGPDRLTWTGAEPADGSATGRAHPGSAGTQGGVRLLAVAVAAVDLERASAAPGGAGDRLPDDALLGARVASTGVAGVLVAEPATEGRLAATLARHGEGPAALYLAVPPSVMADLQARLEGQGERPREGAGPFGPQILARTRPAWGPHLLLVPVPARTDPGHPADGTVGYHRPMSETDAAPTFRDAEPTDAEWIAGLLSDEGYPAGASDIVRRLERFAEMGSLVRIAERDGERLGFIAVHLVPRFEHDDQLARVIAMVVDPAVRSRGVGRALLAEVDRVAVETGCAFVEVTAGHHRADARRLFEAAGFDASLTTYLRKRR